MQIDQVDIETIPLPSSLLHDFYMTGILLEDWSFSTAFPEGAVMAIILAGTEIVFPVNSYKTGKRLVVYSYLVINYRFTSDVPRSIIVCSE